MGKYKAIADTYVRFGESERSVDPGEPLDIGFGRRIADVYKRQRLKHDILADSFTGGILDKGVDILHLICTQCDGGKGVHNSFDGIYIFPCILVDNQHGDNRGSQDLQADDKLKRAQRAER